MKLCVGGGLEFGPVLDSPPWQCPSSSLLPVRQFQAHKSITEVKHTPCSPDLAPHDFWLFPAEIKSFLKGRRFQDIEDIKKMW